MVWRYYRRIVSDRTNVDAASHYEALDVCTRWALTHPEKDRFLLTHGHMLAHHFPKEPAIYAACWTALKADLAALSELSLPVQRTFWYDTLELVFTTKQRKLCIPPTHTAP